MNLNYLKYFIAVAEFNSFSKASEHLFITQPTLSISIQKLESNLGVKLLNRTKKGQKPSISLTNSGKYFLDKAKYILGQFESIKLELHHDNVNTRILKLGTIPSISTKLVHKFIIALRAAFPHIIIEQITDNSLNLKNCLEQGNIDVMLSIFSKENEGIKRIDKTSNMLFDRKYLIAVAQEHLLAKKTSFSIEQLNGTPYIDRMDCEIRPYLQKVFKARKINPKITGKTQHDYLANSLISSGEGLAIVPGEIEIPGVVTLPFSDFSISRLVGLKWKDNEESEIIDFCQQFQVSYDQCLEFKAAS